MQKKILQDYKSAMAEKILGRNLPCNIEAERAVLGSLLLYDNQFQLVTEILSDQDFYLPANKIIYQAMLEINRKNYRIDLVTLQDELERNNKSKEIGGLVYLLSLQEDIPALGLLEQHALIVKEKSILRELIASAADIISNCYSQNEKDINTVVDEAEKIIFNISQRRVQQSFVQLNIWLKKTFKYLSDMRSERGLTGISTGYKKLNELTSGFQNGDFVVLAARPSMGKTALALSFARNAAICDLSVGFFSLEMSAEQLSLRLLSSESGVAHRKIKNAMVNSDEWISLTHVAAKLANSKLFIDDTAMQTITDIRSKARKLKMEHGLDFLIIDYLQLIHGQKKYENRHQEVSAISRSLKALAKELNIPIIALSQLSRAVDSRVDKRPMLSDLRESGAIEQDADLILFLYRDYVYNQDTEDPNLAELIIGKQRNGPTGFLTLNFQNELTLFQDPENPDNYD